jgi:hypothetical protein
MNDGPFGARLRAGARGRRRFAFTSCKFRSSCVS